MFKKNTPLKIVLIILITQIIILIALGVFLKSNMNSIINQIELQKINDIKEINLKIVEVSKNIDIKTKPDEDMIKTKKIKRRNQYLDEAKSKESFEEEEILKIEKLKNGRNPRERIDKLNLTEKKFFGKI